MVFARSIMLSSLSEHVRGVISLCAKEEMIWSDAHSFIASVTDTHAIWNWPDVIEIRGSMSLKLLPIQGYATSTICAWCPLPNPTVGF
jgi:hypothetical protein